MRRITGATTSGDTTPPLPTGRRCIAAATFALLASPAFAASVVGTPFPNNDLTVFDATQNTLRRVALPKPDCAVQVSDCQDIDVLNTLDGFSTQPRITVQFSADIDPATVTSETVYLVSLGDPISGQYAGERVGINQVVWDPATKTVAAESDQLLREHVRYLLVVTNGVRNAAGKAIDAGAGRDAASGLPLGRGGSLAYRTELRDALRALPAATLLPVAASVFTTQSATTELARINARIKRSSPAPVDFNIGSTAGSTGVRALFNLPAVSSIQFNRQTGTAPTYTTSSLPLSALGIVPGAIAQVAYGRYRSPNYETPQRYIPPTSTLLGAPQQQGTNDLLVQIFLPAGAKPAGGWPVAIFGHGFGDSMYGAPWTVASVLASGGMAVVSINVVGHGGGMMGALNVQRTGLDPVVVPGGGRGIDQDGNGAIDSTEGVNAVAPRVIIGSRDGLRQTTVDLMQLVRQIEAGVDIDGDGSTDLNATRIYYAGQSFGGIYGTIFLGSEPSLKAGVPNVPGGSITEVARLGFFRVLTAITLATRTPSLINLPPLPGVPFPNNLQFNESVPLRNLPPVTNTVPGAVDIAKFLDRSEWVSQSGNPVSYAPKLKDMATPVIFQLAKGDQTVPNPTTTAILRAGDFGSRATYFRNDLAYAANPAVGKNPHAFISNIANAAAVGYAVGAQQQIAAFFASNGTTIIDPDGAGPYFEVPIVGPLPEALNYIP